MQAERHLKLALKMAEAHPIFYKYSLYLFNIPLFLYRISIKFCRDVKFRNQ